jgi:hypothetical protein
MHIESDRSYGIVARAAFLSAERERLLPRAALQPPFCFPQMLNFSLNNQLAVVAESDPVLLGEALGTVRDQIHVRALVQHFARGPDRIVDTLDAAHTARTQRCSIHHQGVKLNATVTGEKAAAAGVKSGIIFHEHHGLLDCIERRPAALQNPPPGSQSGAHASNVGLD